MNEKNFYLTKQKLFQILGKNTGLSKKNVDSLFSELLNMIKAHMSEKGPKKFILPGFFKLTVKDIPAQKERVGINPFTKEKMIFKAKSASKKLKVRVLKNLRDVVN